SSFFFSSRRRHTSFSRDWSSDVCSSDLSSTRACRTGSAGAGGWSRRRSERECTGARLNPHKARMILSCCFSNPKQLRAQDGPTRSEERRVGKECRARESRLTSGETLDEV